MNTVGYRHHLKSALICAVLCLMAQETLGSKDYFSAQMEKHWLDVYKPMKSVVANGALFNQKANVQEPMLQFVLASETLKVYNTILNTLLKKTQDQTTRGDLKYLDDKIKDLRKAYFSGVEVLTSNLKNLQTINTNDAVVQHKAIKEMKLIYNWASWLGETNKQSPSTLRRRRQTRRRSVRPNQDQP